MSLDDETDFSACGIAVLSFEVTKLDCFTGHGVTALVVSTGLDVTIPLVFFVGNRFTSTSGVGLLGDLATVLALAGGVGFPGT